jgi:hypothetical protein
MTKQTQCPCKDCLTFSICRYRLINKHFNQITLLSNTCCYLRNYLGEIFSDTTSRTVITRKLFKLENIRMGE